MEVRATSLTERIYSLRRKLEGRYQVFESWGPRWLKKTDGEVGNFTVEAISLSIITVDIRPCGPEFERYQFVKRIGPGQRWFQFHPIVFPGS